MQGPQKYTLFPYTTLFRSHPGPDVGRGRHRVPAPASGDRAGPAPRSEEHTSELQSRLHLVCRLLLEKKNRNIVHTAAAAIWATFDGPNWFAWLMICSPRES